MVRSSDTSLNRRNFLRVAGAAGTMPLWLPASALGQAADKPQRGGVLTINYMSAPPNSDILGNTTSRTLYSVAPCHNSLVKFNPQNPNEIVGDLARSWEFSKDGKQLIFRIIENAHFHDGVPLTSADVKFTFDRTRNPPDGVISLRRQFMDVVADIQTPDKYTVVFSLKRPSPSFLSILASGWMLILPKHFFEAGGDYKNKILGSGPFKLQEYKAGVSLSLVRNDKYHIPERPYLDGITYYIIPDPATVASYLRTEQLHVWENISGEDSRKAEREYGNRVMVQGTPSYGYGGIFINATRAPWSDVRVRHALAYAIDHRDALKVLRQNDGYLGGLMPAQGKWSIPDEELAKIPGYSADQEGNLAQARRLLKEAGQEGLKAKIMTKRGVTFEALAIYTADALSKVGINCTLDLQDEATSQDNLINRRFDLVAWDATVAADDPDGVFSEIYLCNAGRNYSGSCVDKVDALFAQQSAELDEAKRMKLVREMEVTALQDMGRIILYWRKGYLAHSRKVRGWLRRPAMDNNMRMQDVWLAS